ncbi:hypothetical protein GCM10023174_04970 [Chelativorans composti]|uniref:Uncharacterized protein n=1 Tax=Chelativorans composti TaxID=768533 RepID=A0ABW5DI09_9HYPH
MLEVAGGILLAIAALFVIAFLSPILRGIGSLAAAAFVVILLLVQLAGY